MSVVTSVSYTHLDVYKRQLLNPSSYVTMVDINERAVALANENAKNNKIENVKVYTSDGFANVKGLFSTIVSNPPIRAGKKVIYPLFEKLSLIHILSPTLDTCTTTSSPSEPFTSFFPTLIKRSQVFWRVTHTITLGLLLNGISPLYLSYCFKMCIRDRKI